MEKFEKNNLTIVPNIFLYTTKEKIYPAYVQKHNSNGDKRIQSIDLIETYTHGTSKDLVSEKEEIKFNNIIK